MFAVVEFGSHGAPLDGGAASTEMGARAMAATAAAKATFMRDPFSDNGGYAGTHRHSLALL
jgi:hypothetical protein